MHLRDSSQKSRLILLPKKKKIKFDGAVADYG